MLLLLLSLTLQAPAPATSTATKPRLLLLDLENQGAAADVVKTISAGIAAGLQKTGAFDVISAADVRAMANLEAERQNMGCEGGASCLGEIAQAYGADLLVHGSIGQLGELTVVNLNLFDAKTGAAAGREKIQAKKLENVARLVDVATARLAQAWQKQPPDPYPEIDEDASSPLTLAGEGIAAVGGIGVVVGAVIWGMAHATLTDPRSSRDDKNGANDNWDLGQAFTLGSAAVVTIGVGVTTIGMFQEQ